MAHVHHVSNTLILKSVVVFDVGVNSGVVNDDQAVSFQLVHQLVEYCTFVIVDGHAVLLAVHVISHA